MSDIDTSTESEDTPLSWPTAEQVVPDDQVTTEPEPEPGQEPAEPVAPEAPAPEAPAPEAPAAPEQEPAAPEPTALEALPQSWQDTIKQLRKENGDYRVQYKALDDVFGNYNDVERAKFLDLASGLADESRHQEVAREFITIGSRILKHYGVDVGELAAPDPTQPMTRAEYEAAERAREEARDTERRMAEMTAKVQGFGYELGSLDHYALLRAAQADSDDGTPVDLDTAHAKVQAWKAAEAKRYVLGDSEEAKALRKEVYDSFVKEHARKAGAHLPTPPQTGGAPAEQPAQLPEDEAEAFQQARAAFHSMLDAQ